MNNSSKALWTPSKDYIATTHLSTFSEQFLPNQDYNYETLFQYSIDHPSEFWSSIWDYSGIIGEKGKSPYFIPKNHIKNDSFFPNATLNYAGNLLRRKDDHIALIGRMEDGRRISISYKELYNKVAKLAFQLKKDGLKVGDRVAGFTPNCIEAIIGMLATTSLGGVWTSCSPDFGFQGVLDRFGQVAPKFLISANAYSYNGKIHSCINRLEELSKEITSIEKIIVFEYFPNQQTYKDIINGFSWDDYLNNPITKIDFIRLPFDHPLFIMYSSGTTGKPKCIIHKAGGVLLEHQKEHLLHTNLSSTDVFFYYSTCGWMMWNWLVSGLACGSSLVIFDGSPFYPTPNCLLDLIDEEKINVFGVSAKYISALQNEGLKPKESHQLSSLNIILSTGSPLSSESYKYVYRDIKENVILSSISGGTDLIGAFISGNPTLPVYEGELQCKGLGFDLDVVDEKGNSIQEEKGELICRNAFPSMPLGFWDDENDERYFKAYYTNIEHVWSQGDFAEVTNNKGIIIHGRSDAVLNPGGVRIGTAEIYRQVLKIKAVKECIAIGQDWKNDCRVILFVVLKGNILLDQQLIDTIKETVKTNATPRHVPSKIIQVADIPKTISGKIVELAVRNIIHGKEVKNTSALKNPEALKQFENIEELSK